MNIIKIIPAVLVLCCAFVANAANDIAGHWAEENIKIIEQKGIMTGDGEAFMPDRNITRAEFVSAVMRAIGAKTSSAKSAFSDVANDSIYAPYIMGAAEFGVVSGYDDGTFRPERALTREESVIIMSRAFGFLSGYNLGKRFVDYKEISEKAYDAVSYAVRKEIISGYPDRTLRPRGTLTRAEASVMILKASETEASEPGFVLGYPRLSQKGEHGAITIELCTNMPCNIYYTLNSADVPGAPAAVNIDKLLSTVTYSGKQQTAKIYPDAIKAYNVYLMAVTPDGHRSNIVTIENTAPIPFKKGDGTKEKPYVISGEDELKMLRYFPDGNFSLEKDITLTEKWTPIDDFRGTLDGAGHRIDGLYVKVDNSMGGFFRRISKGEIKNLTIDGEVYALTDAGIFAGELVDAKISFCTASGRVEAITNNAGGFFGTSTGRIENCLSGVYTVEAGSYAGGIAGRNYGTIKNSLSAVYLVLADFYAGGITSVNDGGRIEGCVSASRYVYDVLLMECGRIAIPENEAIMKGNYAYIATETTSQTGVNEEDNQDGADTTWNEFVDKNLLCVKLGWDTDDWTGGGRKDRYLIPRPKKTQSPTVEEGLSEYSPIRVSDIEGLRAIQQNPDKHYLLTNDIYFTSIAWTPIFDTSDIEQGFTGTLDGGNNTVYNITIKPGNTGNCSIFGMLTGATVRNLNINSPKLSDGKIIGVICAQNYGTIENCNVDNMRIDIDESAYAGGVVCYNYGLMRGNSASGKIKSTAKNTVIGSICAHNEGFIDDSVYIGDIITSKIGGVSESVAGGICGYNAGGMIYNAYSFANLRQQATTIYAGGVCAIQSEGELYKCSSRGNIISEQAGKAISVSYTGGIAGLVAGGIVVNTFSVCDIKQYTTNSYLGGVCGYNEAAIVQNSYSKGSLLQTNDAEIVNEMPSYAGGICGYNENGIIHSSFAANSDISTYSHAGRICGGGLLEQVYQNAALEMNITAGERGADGTTLGKNRLNTEYFTLSVSEGGAFGWSPDIWVKSNNNDYKMPILSGVRNQSAF